MAENESPGGKRGREKEGSFAAYSAGRTTPDIQLNVLLLLVARRWRSLLDEKLRPIEQSAARMEAMSAIFNSTELPSQVDIAKRLRIEGPTLTRMLDTLEKDGLVQRLADAGDRRAKKLRLTQDGVDVLEEIFDVADIYRDRMFEGVSAETKQMVTDLLQGLLHKLDEGLPGDDENS